MTQTDDLADRLAQVRSAIDDARAQVSGPPVRLIAVSKRHPASRIRAAYALGLRDFGENFAQELATKRDALADLPDLRWHFLGRIQRNKIKLLRGCAWVQTVDRIEVAEALARQHARDDPGAPPRDILVPVNFDEPQKGGVLVDDLDALIDAVRAVAGVRLRGLMVLPPRGSLEDARGHFQHLRDLATRLRDTHALGPDFDQCSMGMSGDFVAAVHAGATMVRVGTAIFGARPPTDKT